MDPEFDEVSVFQECLHCSGTGGGTGDRDETRGIFCQLLVVSDMLTSEHVNGRLGTGAYAGGG